MEIKTFEILDRGTFIPAMGIKMQDYPSFNKKDKWLFKKAGYCGDHTTILLIDIQMPRCNFDPYEWLSCGSRTMKVAHEYIEKKWDNIQSGSVVDVEFILGETTEPKETEAYQEFLGHLSLFSEATKNMTEDEKAEFWKKIK